MFCNLGEKEENAHEILAIMLLVTPIQIRHQG
jgi:hypothetical protein